MIAVSGEHRHDAYQLLIFVGVLGAGIFSLGILSNRIGTSNGHYLTCIISAPTTKKTFKSMTESTLEKKVPVDMFHIALGRVDNLFVCLFILKRVLTRSIL